MSEMIERLTKAIMTAENPHSANRYADMARAAIEAMREPSPEMLQAMEPWTKTSGHQDLVWRAGIDEALK